MDVLNNTQALWENIIEYYRISYQDRIEMYKYERIVYWSREDNAFIVEVPELAGCMSDGRTIEEAMKNADVIISEWIEVAKERGQVIPEPKGKLMYA